ncbi:MAG: hypothetical protein IJG60_03425 [Thermoguttaceae bacterium]|nr:hypothetical protein [Thermoguttaceae bacterium]
MNIRKLWVESLEDRCLLAVVAGGFEQSAELVAPTEATTWVVNTLEDPTGWDVSDNILSLREAIASSVTGDTIVFDSELARGTIMLNGSQLEINNGITIDASDIGGITIDANQQSRVFYVDGKTSSKRVELINLSIIGGKVSGSGGGICSLEGNGLILTNCIISGNNASAYGGGLYGTGSNFTLTNSIISDNSAKSGGGFFDGYCIPGNYPAYCHYTLTNCTVSGNTASDNGDGIYADGGWITLQNVIITDNIYRYTWSYWDATIKGYNVLSTYNRWSSSSLCVDYDPVRPLFVDAENGNYSLADDSQAINLGNNSYITTETDLADNPRIIGGTVDLGAYEYQPETHSTIVTTLIDVVDEIDRLISLREAVALYAEEGDTITFAPELAGGTIALNGNQLEISRGITIDATSVGGITIDANQSSRVFYVSGGTEDTPVELINLTITGGYTEYGGGIYHHSGTMTISDSKIFGNSASKSGGGTYNHIGNVTQINCTITDNSATWGGGFYNWGGSLTITGSEFSNNSANYGGGISNNTGSVTVISSEFFGNSAADVGGGLDNYSGTLMVTDTQISDNSAGNYGGGIYNELDTLTVVGSNISDNSAGTSGGGVHNYSGTTTLTDSIISGNSANSAGGGIYNDNSGNLLITGSSVTGNSANYGGGLRNWYGAMTITSSEIFGNSADCGGGVGNNSGKLTVTDSNIFENLANKDGGGIDNYAGKLTVAGSEISGNSAGNYGGGIYNELDTATATNSNISENSSNSDGGGIHNNNGTLMFTRLSVAGNTANTGGGFYNTDGRITLLDCFISDNCAQAGGGILDTGDKGVLEFTDCVISGNVSNPGGGGGIQFYCISDNNETIATFTNCVISGNSASSYGYGGGILNAGAILAFANCVISGNSATGGIGFGGGLDNQCGTATLYNCTVSGNSASHYGGGITNWGETGVTLYNTIVSLNYAETDVDIYLPGDISECNIIGTDPCFKVAPIFDTEGNLINADSLDLTLSFESMVINTGNNDYVTTETDLVGNPRIITRVVDLGAYEFTDSITLETPSILTGSSDNYVSYGANRHLITWNEIEGASAYELAYSDDNGNSWTSIETSETSAVVTGLIYGKDVSYRVHALGIGIFITSDWSSEKTFNVCPMDVNNNGDISNADRSLIASAWLSEKGDDKYFSAADIDGDGNVANSDRAVLAANWLKDVDDENLLYPRPRATADIVFAEYESADIGIDLAVF